MNSRHDLYQRLYALSVRMCDAARAHDWESLALLEAEAAELNTELPASPQLPLVSMDITAALIKEIIKNDAEIRRHTEPWLAEMEAYLGDAPKRLGTRRRIRHPDWPAA